MNVPPARPGARDGRVAFAAGAAALVGYGALAPGVPGPGDAAELTLCLAHLSVPHPTGYPLYVLAGRVFGVALTAGGASWPLAANLWSAAGAAVATGLFTRVALALARPAASGAASRWTPAPALAAAALLATHPVWLAAATTAEVHAWALAWTAGAAWLALSLAGGGAPAPAARGWALWGLVCGAGLAHHVTSVLFAAPLTAALALRARRAGALRPAHVGAAGAAALVPLSAYVFVALRAFRPAPGQWPLLEPSWASVAAHLAGGPFAARYLGGFAPAADERVLLDATVWPYLAGGLCALAAAAAAARATTRAPVVTALLAGALLQAGFSLVYAVPDPAAYLLPALACAFLGVPAAAGAAGALPGAALAATLALPAAAAPGWTRIHAARRARDLAVEARIVELWRTLPIERGVVLWNDDRLAMLELRQRLHGERPRLVLANPAMLTWRAPRAALARVLGADPLAGLALRDERDLARVPAHVAAVTGLPVVDFAAYARGEPPIVPRAGAPRRAPRAAPE